MASNNLTLVWNIRTSDGNCTTLNDDFKISTFSESEYEFIEGTRYNSKHGEMVLINLRNITTITQIYKEV